MAVTVPLGFHEVVNWALSPSTTTCSAVTSASIAAPVVRQVAGAGLVPGRAHHAHALHSRTVAALRLGIAGRTTGLSRPTHRFLVWDMTARNPLPRWPEALLKPGLGKELVVYCQKP